MRSSDRRTLPFKKGAITKWKKLVPVLESERMFVLLKDIDRFANEYTLLPQTKDIFNMFRMIFPEEVKVVFVGQSPYSGYCPATETPYACGLAFLPAPGCVTTPATLRNIVSEVCRDMGKQTNIAPKDMLLNWISQGTMMLNSTMTLGKNCPSYLEDHSVAWEEVMREILLTISDKLDPIFVLVGSNAWKYEDSCGAIFGTKKVLKVSHPAAQQARAPSARVATTAPWMKSCVFSNISKMLIDKDVMPIRWL